jgi:HAMP domain-containing protein
MNLWINTARDDLDRLIGKVDILMLNDEEARMLTGEYQLARAGSKLLSRGLIAAVIKRGEHGATVFISRECSSLRHIRWKMSKTRPEPATALPEDSWVIWQRAASRRSDEVVKVFCEALMKATSLPPERLFLVPGNHDVDRGKIKNVHIRRLYSFKTEDEVTEVFYEPPFFRVLMDKFAAFNVFAEHAMGRRVYSETNFYFTEPISILTNHIITIGKTDDLSSRLSFKRGDEIGVLSNEFNNMAQKLSEARRKLLEQSFFSVG